MERVEILLFAGILNGPTCGRNRDGVSSILVVTGPRAKPWACNLLMAQGHVRDCELVRGPRVEK